MTVLLYKTRLIPAGYQCDSFAIIHQIKNLRPEESPGTWQRVDGPYWHISSLNWNSSFSGHYDIILEHNPSMSTEVSGWKTLNHDGGRACELKSEK